MKTNYTLMAIAILCIGLFASGKKLFDQFAYTRSKTTVVYNEIGPLCTLTATFPKAKSTSIGQYIKNWSQKNGKSLVLSGDTALLSSLNGPCYKLYMDETNLTVIASRNQSDWTAYALMKNDYKLITDFITKGSEQRN
ncbi:MULTISPECIES: hypothetical protein [Sphingobacterium]|uniref:Uncharacterized protein n=1 Tax=Sphingobacterium athyrii TaxID=2152717 RepID=A0A363NYC6_9SPHI|nr:MULTISPECIES: hypothetical protein [Sphingobacterium]PUV25805.1 hypothetical protein DCO56_02185 [Sphingobacterium athyrii]